MRKTLASGRAVIAIAAIVVLTSGRTGSAQIPHGQSKPPGPALSPEEARRKMTVPDGFHVELVASEPNIVNPVAMTFDERGRAWITESLEYPRRSPGRGRDRIKVIEDTDGDGKADKFTIFADGLNIPSGIAVGHGGVWVANAPDILFMQDTDGDGKADTREVVVTGFGRDDTHELPNSLTWGPDGYLYGLNGVFNHSHVVHKGRDYRFTCAMFRINPRTRDFEIFAEGTSNPWGIAWDPRGNAFISACVIDHLWHIAEDGYYHRQGGPYPPFTWKLGSIVKHKHQKAAYCGIHYFDSDAYPPEYRDRLYMGNIHGNCINVDVLQERGSSYFATPNDDFLSANDAWFMPVVQKTGPDGCLWVLDWYDRYHCYQDANRDPAGIDRLRGRLYRVRYGDSPHAGQFNLAEETDEQLIQRLRSPNVFFRDIAQRVLAERNSMAGRPALQGIVLNDSESRKTRLHALWALAGTGVLDPQFHTRLLTHEDAELRSWGVRIAGNMGTVANTVAARVRSRCSDSSPLVLLQAAVAARKIPEVDTIPALLDVLASAGDDTTIPHIVWQNLHPLIESDTQKFLAELASVPDDHDDNVVALAPRIADRILAVRETDIDQVADLFRVLMRRPETATAAARSLQVLATRIQTGEIPRHRVAALRERLSADVDQVLRAGPGHPLFLDTAIAAASWSSKRAIEVARERFASAETGDADRLRTLQALASAEEVDLDLTMDLLSDDQQALSFRGAVIGVLGQLREPAVAERLLAVYGKLHPELRPRALELLAGRTAWSIPLLRAIDADRISASDLNATQIRTLFANPDAEVKRLVTREWGALRTERDPAREQFINRMRRLVQTTAGDPHKGRVAFRKVCGQCHKIYGEGEEVGPDITLNGRSSFEQLLSNVFDPSLVIGNAYQATTVVTSEGKVVTGLLAEDSPQRVVLKVQGGKQETIARDDIEEVKQSELSLMPEGLEKQLSEQEIVDLFAYLTLNRPPEDPNATRLPGAGPLPAQQSAKPEDFPQMVARVLPDFTTRQSGHDGVALLPNHEGRQALRVHPLTREEPCVLQGNLLVPETGRSQLKLAVGRHPEGDWTLIVRVNDERVTEVRVNERSAPNAWMETSVDMTPFAGTRARVRLEAHDLGRWYYEFAYFGRAELVTESLNESR